MSWQSYALVEFRHSFKAPGKLVPGGRDFLSLTAVFTLLISIVAISSALQRGILVNFADSLIGYAEGAGVPIRVSLDSGVVGYADPRRIASQFANSAEIGGDATTEPTSSMAAYEFHPFVEVENRSTFVLPEEAWKATDGAGSAFFGWATASASPLWRWVGDGLAGKPRLGTIALARSAFGRSFDRAAYEEAVVRLAPEPMVAEWRSSNPPGGDLNSIILRVPYSGSTYRAQLFDVVWVDSFPAVQPIAYLVPLELYRVLNLAARADFFSFLPERVENPERGFRRGVQIDNADTTFSTEEERAAFAACLGRDAVVSDETPPYDLLVELPAPVRQADAEACLDAAGAKDYRYTRQLAAHDTPLRLHGNELVLECSAVDYRRIQLPEFQPCRQGAQEIALPVFAEYSTGFAYAPERTGIAELVDAVRRSRLQIGKNAETGQPISRQLLYISELYQNSIDRFTYLIRVVDYLVAPAALFFGIIVIYLISIQVYVFLSKRRRNYGVLMARGMGWGEIYKIIVGQFAASILIASLLAFFVVIAAKQVLHASFSGSAAYALGLTALGLKEPALMDRLDWDGPAAFVSSVSLSAADLLFGILVVCVFVFPALLIALYRLPIRPATAPMELISVQ